MTDYTPPLRDLQFVLDELVGLDAIASLPGATEIGSDDVAAILDQATGIMNVDRSGNEFQMESTLPSEDLSALLINMVQSGVKVLFFAEEVGTLEDVFLHVTKGGI